MNQHFAWSLMKQTLEVWRNDSKHPFPVFVLLQFLKNLTGDFLLTERICDYCSRKGNYFCPSNLQVFLKNIKSSNVILSLSLSHNLPEKASLKRGLCVQIQILFSVKVINSWAKLCLQIALDQIRAVPLTHESSKTLLPLKTVTIVETKCCTWLFDSLS